MASVELRPGDILSVVWNSVQKTSLGIKEVESSFACTYDELLERLKLKSQTGKSRKSVTEGARFSRLVALSASALKKGKWSTGAEIDRGEVFKKLLAKFYLLGKAEYEYVTDNARRSLGSLIKGEEALLAPIQKKELQDAIDAIKSGKG